ncbi:MAG TPA: hypothetical protein VFA62_04870 [Acidimicrobiia bacterium]|nr:hypothetical protein [Acidimicrobiia bacterium]
MARVEVGVQLWQQDTTVDELRRTWREADGMGVAPYDLDPVRRILT